MIRHETGYDRPVFVYNNNTIIYYKYTTIIYDDDDDDDNCYRIVVVFFFPSLYIPIIRTIVPNILCIE